MADERIDGWTREKTIAIVSAMHANALGRAADAATLYRKAADLEERIASVHVSARDADAIIDAISAVSCWLAASEPERALVAGARFNSDAARVKLDIGEAARRELAALLKTAATRVDRPGPDTLPETPDADSIFDIGGVGEAALRDFSMKPRGRLLMRTGR